jgi:hypothetical protein
MKYKYKQQLTEKHYFVIMTDIDSSAYGMKTVSCHIDECIIILINLRLII